jgi:hypothetical protein
VRESDAALERWLNREVLPVVDAMQAEPARGITAAEADERLRAHHAHRLARTS